MATLLTVGTSSLKQLHALSGHIRGIDGDSRDVAAGVSRFGTRPISTGAYTAKRQ